MSVLNKTPYVEQVIASLSKRDLEKLQSYANGDGTCIPISLINNQ